MTDPAPWLKTTRSAVRWARKHLRLHSEEDPTDTLERLYGEGLRELLPLIDYYVSKYNDYVARGTATLYRMIDVPEDVDVDDIDWDRVGNHWSFSWDGAGVYLGQGGGDEGYKNIMIQAEVSVACVGWEEGFTFFLTEGRMVEDECYLESGCDIVVTKVYQVTETRGRYANVVEELIEEPFEATT